MTTYFGSESSVTMETSLFRSSNSSVLQLQRQRKMRISDELKHEANWSSYVRQEAGTVKPGSNERIGRKLMV